MRFLLANLRHGCLLNPLKANDMNAKKTIEPGTVLTARSACDYDCIFRVPVISRNGSFVTLSVHGSEVRRKIKVVDGEETVKAFGSFSMAPVFAASDAVAE